MSYNTESSIRLSSPSGDNSIYVYDRNQQKFFTANGTEVTDSEKITDLRILNSISAPSGNTATTNPEEANSPNNTSGVTLNPTQAFGQPSSVKFKSIVENGNDTLRYPILSTKDDYILFRAMEINPDSGVVRAGRDDSGQSINVVNSGGAFSPLSGAFGTNSNRRLFRNVDGGGSVRLSIQAPITDQNISDWGPNGIDMMQAIMYNSAMEGLQSDGNLGDTFTKAIESLGKEAAGVFQQLFGNGQGSYKSLFAAMAAGNPGIFNRATGLSFNPNLELIFNGPQLRPFNFSFLLSASSEDESKEIKSIIKFFKYHMAPKVNTGTGLFLRTPNVFSITYMSGKGNEHRSIGRITSDKGQKACALFGFNVDYTSLGSYMTYDDTENSMIAYRLQMQFQEIVPVYDVDYEDNHPIGY